MRGKYFCVWLFPLTERERSAALFDRLKKIGNRCVVLRREYPPLPP